MRAHWPPWPEKTNASFRRFLRHDRRRQRRRIDLAVGELAEFVRHVFRSLADDGQQMRVVAAPSEGREGNVVQPLWRGAQEVGMAQRQCSQRIAVGGAEHVHASRRRKAGPLGEVGVARVIGLVAATGSCSTTWALVPPAPNEFTPTVQGRPARSSGVGRVGTSSFRFSKSIAGFGSWKCKFGGTTP